jgi:tRNA-Thr(GGU) m(6)t(6)A37 methyltransferase TsaA
MFWKKRPAQRREPVLGPVTLQPIGYVRNDVARPRAHGWERVESEVVVLPEHEGKKLEGIEGYSHVIVVSWLDLAPMAPEHPEKLTVASGNAYGIFATRSQLRPNPVGVSAVALLGREGGVLRVRGLDAIDGTGVLDIKPYLPEYDSIPDARIPVF